MIGRHLLPLLLVAAASLSNTALAQINPFRGSSAVPLSASDISALTEATNHLLDRPGLADGNSETWSNPAGASGTVTAGPAVQRKGLACRIANYRIVARRPGAERTRTLTWCKTKDGWKIG
jgi:hypothetical protein